MFPSLATVVDVFAGAITSVAALGGGSADAPLSSEPEADPLKNGNSRNTCMSNQSNQ